MTCSELSARIEQLQPDAHPRDVARLCLLLANHHPSLDGLADEETLLSEWRQMGFRLQVASDQHAAMSQELDELANTNPVTLAGDQATTLLRVIRVQSQLLQLYLGSYSDPLEA